MVNKQKLSKIFRNYYFQKLESIINFVILKWNLPVYKLLKYWSIQDYYLTLNMLLNEKKNVLKLMLNNFFKQDSKILLYALNILLNYAPALNTLKQFPFYSVNVRNMNSKIKVANLPWSKQQKLNFCRLLSVKTDWLLCLLSFGICVLCAIWK